MGIIERHGQTVFSSDYGDVPLTGELPDVGSLERGEYARYLGEIVRNFFTTSHLPVYEAPILSYQDWLNTRSRPQRTRNLGRSIV